MLYSGIQCDLGYPAMSGLAPIHFLTIWLDKEFKLK